VPTPIAFTPPAATQPQPAVVSSFTPPAGSQLGLVGRLTTTEDGDRVDAGVLLVYTPSKLLLHDVVTQPVAPVSEKMIQNKELTVRLGGLLHVPRDMEVAIWHAGGTATLGNAYLYIDGKRIGAVGDDMTKNISYRVNLTAGEHIVGWHLIGGRLGNSLVGFYDPLTAEALPVYAPPGLLKSLQLSKTTLLLDLNADAPLPKRPPDLLGPRPTPSGTANP
jgi:hypothetical protein